MEINMIAVLLANGFEEIEALCPADLLMRAGKDVRLVSISGDRKVVGTHKVEICADTTLDMIDRDEIELLFLPGGMPGAENLYNSEKVRELVLYMNENKRPIAAICAAPLVLGRLGILKGKKATCYPGFEDELKGAVLSELPTVTDKNIITGAGMGASFALGIAAIELLCGKETADRIRASTMIDGK